MSANKETEQFLSVMGEKKEMRFMSRTELEMELAIYRNSDYAWLIELLLKGLWFVITNWKVIKEEINRILRKDGQ